MSALRSHVSGRRFGEPRRHGKWLVLSVGDRDDAVLLHFGMTGSLHWCELETEPHRHDRVEFRCDGGALRYRDMRKLTGLRLGNPDDVLGELGPDATTIPRAQLRDLLAARRGGLKAALQDQEFVAGLGNLLVDEILWRARLHPRRGAASLDDGEADRVFARMGTVLRQGSRAGYVPGRPSWLTGHRDEPGGRCPRCSTLLERGRIGGRATVWCPHCQPAP